MNDQVHEFLLMIAVKLLNQTDSLLYHSSVKLLNQTDSLLYHSSIKFGSKLFGIRAGKWGISLDEEDLNLNIKDYNEEDSYNPN